MQPPNSQPYKENEVVTSVSELSKLVADVLSSNSGLFMKVFAKKDTKAYLINLLVDRNKVLCIEATEVGGETLRGKEALDTFKELLNNPMIVDVYPLDEVGVKMSIAENIDVYNESPKVALGEIFKGIPVTTTTKTITTKATTEVKTGEKIQPTEEKTEKPKEMEKPSPETVRKAPEIVVEIKGGNIPEKAFKEYSKALLEDAKKIRSFKVQRIEFKGELTGGVLYLNVYIYGTSEGSMREIAEKRMLHSIGKYAPIILREADVKPVLRELKVILNGKEIAPEEIKVKEKRRSGKVDREGRISLTVLDEVWPYFSAMIRTAMSDVEKEGVSVKRANFDVLGRRELEINVSMVVETELPKDEVESMVKRVLSSHARELSRTINKYITIHKVEVDVLKPPELAIQPKKVSGKAAEILSRKAELEKEVEDLLKKAGIDELSFLAEEKKKESEDLIIRNRVEPAMEELKNRLHRELKLVPRADFKWLKMRWDIQDTTVYVDLEASFAKEEVGGLFGTLSGVSDEKIKNDATETILYIMRDVGREHGITIKPRKINVIVR